MDIKRICLVIDDSVYDYILHIINHYVQYLIADGYFVIIHNSIDEDAEDIKSYLVTLYNEVQSLSGAILIGDVPYITFYHSQDKFQPTFITDLYYMDLTGQ